MTLIRCRFTRERAGWCTRAVNRKQTLGARRSQVGARSRNKKRVASIAGEVVLRVETPIDQPCYSRKIKFASLEDVPANGYDGTPLRGYLCSLCGWWHCTSGGTIKWRRPERGSVRR